MSIFSRFVAAGAYCFGGMKRFTLPAACWVWALVFLSVPSATRAASGSQVEISAGLAKLFGNITAFQATADVQSLDAAGQEVMRTPMTLLFLNGNMRVDVDMNRATGQSAHPGVLSGLKQAGLDRVVSLVRTDRKQVYVVFPNARSCISMPMSEADAAASDKSVKVEKKVLGNETVGNRACVKHRMVLKSAKGDVLLEATTWNANDMNGFPVQILLHSKERSTVLRFAKVEMKRPAAGEFEMPRGYTQYGSPEALLLAIGEKQKQASAPKQETPAGRGAAPPKSGTTPARR